MGARRGLNQHDPAPAARGGEFSKSEASIQGAREEETMSRKPSDGGLSGEPSTTDLQTTPPWSLHMTKVQRDGALLIAAGLAFTRLPIASVFQPARWHITRTR